MLNVGPNAEGVIPGRHPLEMKTGDAGLVTVATPRTPSDPIANVIVGGIEGDQFDR